MRIIVPCKLTPLNAINFTNQFADCDNESTFTYDFQFMQHCHPYGLLVVAAAIRENMKRFPDAVHELINTEATQGGRFAAEFGFYQSVGKDIGYAKEEDETGDRYIPIKMISAKELHETYKGTTLLNDKVNRHAFMLAQMLVGDQPQVIRDVVQYCFREIIRNAFEHAQVDGLWVCGQYWPTRQEAEIAILDEGIGILKSLQSNKRITAKTYAEANVLALQPGLSRTIGMKSDPFDVWQNSGYGLYVASTLCAINGGYFLISSGDSAILVNGEKQSSYQTNQTGTAVCLNIRLDSKKLRKFDDTLAAIVAEGEKKAKEYGEKRIVTASKITTVASMVRHIENAIQADSEKTEDENGVVPLNEIVTFQAVALSKEGGVEGTFDYGEQQFQGVLLNVTNFNRQMYVSERMRIRVVVRRFKNGRYCLLEEYRYNKQNNRK